MLDPAVVERCIRLGQWQNLAMMTGQTIDQVRRCHGQAGEIEEGAGRNISAPAPYRKVQHRSYSPVVVQRAPKLINLSVDHPALSEGRTVFPSMVTSVMDSPRILVSGKESAKLGPKVRKGAWKGMPIFQVTLEERKTCPPSCALWHGCYGNSTHMARRHDAHDPDFLPALWAEVVSTYRSVMNQRTPPPGMVIRLHVLGDFFSIKYVRMWADLLDELPHLHIFGYTARREDADDDESRTIARMLRWLGDEAWDRFAVRFSRTEPSARHAIVVDRPAEAVGAIVCPEQTGQTENCASCGLCWSPAAKNKTIAFIRHGMTR